MSNHPSFLDNLKPVIVSLNIKLCAKYIVSKVINDSVIPAKAGIHLFAKSGFPFSRE